MGWGFKYAHKRNERWLLKPAINRKIFRMFAVCVFNVHCECSSVQRCIFAQVYLYYEQSIHLDVAHTWHSLTSILFLNDIAVRVELNSSSSRKIHTAWKNFFERKYGIFVFDTRFEFSEVCDMCMWRMCDMWSTPTEPEHTHTTEWNGSRQKLSTCYIHNHTHTSISAAQCK